MSGCQHKNIRVSWRNVTNWAAYVVDGQCGMRESYDVDKLLIVITVKCRDCGLSVSEHQNVLGKHTLKRLPQWAKDAAKAAGVPFKVMEWK